MGESNPDFWISVYHWLPLGLGRPYGAPWWAFPEDSRRGGRGRVQGEVQWTSSNTGEVHEKHLSSGVGGTGLDWLRSQPERGSEEVDALLGLVFAGVFPSEKPLQFL